MSFLGNLGAVGRSIGDSGSQVGQGYDISQDWKARQQKEAFEAARQKQAMLMAPLLLKELQNRISEFGQAKPEGIVSTPGGGNAGVTFTPGKGYATQPLTSGASGAGIKQKIQQMASQAPTPEYKMALSQIADSIDLGEDPLKALDKANNLMGQAAGKETQKKTSFKFEPEKGIITDKQGNEWSIYDPELPPDLQKLVGAEKQRKSEEESKKAEVEARKNAEMLDRALKVGDMREAQKQYSEIRKVAMRGVAGHTFLKTVEEQVDAARKGGGEGTTSGDLTLVEGYMQLMFGIDPKGIRGSPKMMEMLLRQGGWDDRAVAAFNSALSGGRLSQDVREQILESSKRQIGSWDQAVLMNGELVDDKRVKDLVERYKRATGQEGDNKKNPDDLSDLGGVLKK